MSNLGKNIQKYRKRAELTVVALAKRLGVTHPTICKYENGQIIPSTDKIPDLADILGCSTDDLYGRTKHKEVKI